MIRQNFSQLKKSSDEKTLFFDFYYNNQKLQNISSNNPICGMTLKKAGSMRFRWNETNGNRDEYFSNLKKSLSRKSGFEKKVVPVELIHSHIVYELSAGNETVNLQGDGLITKNCNLIPTVTVADCMPVYLFDSKTGAFGIVHSGWKGTGIAVEAIKKGEELFDSKPEDFSVILGPHIEKCCYIVNEERASYFIENFGESCVSPLEENGVCKAGGRGLPVVWNSGEGKLFRLSLEKANLNALKNAGIKEENICVIDECTCCNEVFGSNRRETAENPDAIDKTRCFTVQAAFITLD